MVVYGNDGASEHLNKHFITLREEQANKYIYQQVSTVDYLLAPTLGKTNVLTPDQVFHSNNSLWEEIILRHRHAGCYIKLDSFFLFEWIPRSPGLYYTHDGKWAREDAKRNVETAKGGVVIYNPYGKASMLEGGIGNYRLKPFRIEGEEHFMMSASSNGTCHEGFPIAVPVGLYQKYISQIIDRGTVVCTLIGHLKFIPDELDTLYSGYRNVPRLYLLVEDIVAPDHGKSRGMEDLTVSVAVTFTGEVKGSAGLYASYVNFDPSNKNSFRLNIEWMQNEYVGRKYNGTVITDFDQQENHFPNAVFSLDKIMNRTLLYAEVSSVSNRLHCEVNSLLGPQERSINIIGKIERSEVYMLGGSKYDMSGAKIGAVVDTVQGDFNQSDLLKEPTASSSLDLAALVPQLSRLWAEAQKEPDAQTNKERLDAIADAEAAAKKGDENGVLAHLKKAGTWAYGIAEKLTIAIAAKAIEKAMGMP